MVQVPEKVVEREGKQSTTHTSAALHSQELHLTAIRGLVAVGATLTEL